MLLDTNARICLQLVANNQFKREFKPIYYANSTSSVSTSLSTNSAFEKFDSTAQTYKSKNVRISCCKPCEVLIRRFQSFRQSSLAVKNGKVTESLKGNWVRLR